MAPLFRLRTWVVVAAVVATQSPVMFAGHGATAKKKPRLDTAIVDFTQSGSTGTVHVLVQTSGDTTQLATALRSKGIKVRRQLLKSGTFAIDIDASHLAWLQALPGVDAVSVDAPVFSAPLSAESLLTVSGGTSIVKKASDLRAQLGLTDLDPTGVGIGVAVIDSGIAPVEDLSSNISAFFDFTNGQPGVASEPVDGYGHGTHVAGLVAGSGARSNGQYSGVAPDARLIGLRV